MANITIENLTVTYVNKKVETKALKGLNMSMPDGSFNAVVGYSGCGKTTLLKSIAGLLDYKGTIYIDGIDADSLAIGERKVAFVSQNYVLYPNMSIFDNIAFPLKVMGASREEIINRVKAIANSLGLEYCLTRKPKHLSGGQQQRVALARALVKNPSICLLDEPLSNIDPQQRVEARQLIRETLRATGCTVVYVTHDFYEAQNMADTIFVMNDGEIVLSGTPTEVYNSNNEVVKSLLPEDTNGLFFPKQ